MDTKQRTEWEAAAYAAGKEAAEAAASWTVDGNSDMEAARRLLAMLDDGDPEAWDYLPTHPDLSGEWADNPTPRSLYKEVTGLDHAEEEDAAGMAYETLVGSVVDMIADAWERGVDETFAEACEAELRRFTDASEQPCSDYGLEVCPDCGNAGIKIGRDGYEPCTRFLTCWTDGNEEPGA